MGIQKNHTQVNIAIPQEWKTQLQNIARIRSIEEGRTITFRDLMREGIQEKFQLQGDIEPENED